MPLILAVRIVPEHGPQLLPQVSLQVLLRAGLQQAMQAGCHVGPCGRQWLDASRLETPHAVCSASRQPCLHVSYRVDAQVSQASFISVANTRKLADRQGSQEFRGLLLRNQHLAIGLGTLGGYARHQLTGPYASTGCSVTVVQGSRDESITDRQAAACITAPLAGCVYGGMLSLSSSGDWMPIPFLGRWWGTYLCSPLLPRFLPVSQLQSALVRLALR
jgi:hypothetical protein